MYFRTKLHYRLRIIESFEPDEKINKFKCLHLLIPKRDIATSNFVDMRPNIIARDSNFVVVTYWWGRGNINKNTGVPCPEDLGPGEAQDTVKPTTYDKMIVNWERSCKKSGCNFMAVEYPNFAQKGMYQTAINYKPRFIMDALKACYPRAVLYIDGDMHIQRYPAIFDMQGVDYMARNWNCDVRKGHMDTANLCYFPYVFETSGGIMYFNNTRVAKELLEQWDVSVQKYPGKAEDRLISQVFNNQKLLLKLSTIDLPVEYLWLNQEYDANISKKYWNKNSIFITHPECLTGEERAHDQGAASQRYPPRYNYQITDRITCKLKKMPFYEYIFFDKREDVAFFGDWTKLMDGFGLIERIPFSKKFGDYNEVVRENDKRLVELFSNDEYIKHLELFNRGRGRSIGYVDRELVPRAPPVYLIEKSSHILSGGSGGSQKYREIRDRCIMIQRAADIIPLILLYTKGQQEVIYVPKNARMDSIKRVASIAEEAAKDSDVSFIAKNLNVDNLSHYKKEYTLKLDKDKPMFFGYFQYDEVSEENNVLLNLLRMSKTLSQLQTHFNSSVIFPSRIRTHFY